MQTMNKSENTSAQTKQEIGSMPNKAVRLWLAILCTVLAVLFLETRNNTASDYNLLLNGDSETIGAKVSVDGSSVGIMQASSAIGGSVCRAKVADGEHTIDVQKPGFKPFHRQIGVRGQAYVGVDMGAAGAPATGGPAPAKGSDQKADQKGDDSLVD